MKKVIIVDKVHPQFSLRLQEMGFEIVEEYQKSSDDIPWHEYAGMIIRSRFPIDKSIFSQAKALQFIARVGAGLENIDLSAAKQAKVKVLAAPEGNRHALGEHALGMLLSLFNRLLWADQEVRKGIWLREENRGLELRGKTVGLIGYGYMGSAFASKLRGMDCRVIAYDLYRKGFASSQVEEVSLDYLKSEADIISLHLPESDETYHYLDEEFIASCKKNFFLLNTARGKNVKTAALVKALQEGKILGACLDVLEFEKSSFENIFQAGVPDDLNYLFQSPKVVLSPHIAGWTKESKELMAKVLLEKIENLNL